MVPVDLSTAVSVKVIAVQMGVTLFSKATTKPSNGVITVTWSAGDTDTIGPVDIEFEVTWAPGRVQTFRASEQVFIVADLG
jgi:predicted membrane protein